MVVQMSTADSRTGRHPSGNEHLKQPAISSSSQDSVLRLGPREARLKHRRRRGGALKGQCRSRQTPGTSPWRNVRSRNV